MTRFLLQCFHISLHFESAAMFAGLAATIAVAGRALAGDSFKNDRVGTASSSSTDNPSSQFSNSNSQPSSFVRQSSNSDQSQAIQDLRTTIDSLHKTIEAQNNKIDSMKPGDVLVKAIQQKNLISETLTLE